MKKYCVLPELLIAFLLSGCAHTVPSQYNGAVVKYAKEGASKATVIADWGIPDSAISVDKDTTAYQWNSDNGSTSSGNFDTHTLATGSATSGTDCLGCGVQTFGVGASHTAGATSANIETHACALTVLVNNSDDKVKAANLVGTVDDKCYSHFEKALTLNPNAVDLHNQEITHNQHVATGKALVGMLTLVGAGAAIYHANH
ncbi:hypothetical protein [Pseudocitrobacter faecalis]|uniref:Lipoprotein n=1 Tax=Pseudocitrobacter faecalis TaxID=1398493 RepID=A0ABX9G2D4_9ENTR|nr:hypothetical protein DFQ50_101140 [Pseudocitrobacter faecalis]